MERKKEYNSENGQYVTFLFLTFQKVIIINHFILSIFSGV